MRFSTILAGLASLGFVYAGQAANPTGTVSVNPTTMSAGQVCRDTLTFGIIESSLILYSVHRCSLRQHWSTESTSLRWFLHPRGNLTRKAYILLHALSQSIWCTGYDDPFQCFCVFNLLLIMNFYLIALYIDPYRCWHPCHQLESLGIRHLSQERTKWTWNGFNTHYHQLKRYISCRRWNLEKYLDTVYDLYIYQYRIPMADFATIIGRTEMVLDGDLESERGRPLIVENLAFIARHR
jgi:hypothetical protein